MTLLEMDVAHLLVAALVTIAAAAVQGTLGFGFGLLSVSLLRLVDPALAPVPQMVVTLFLVVLLARRERQFIVWREVAWVSQGRVLGAAAGALVLGLASTRVLDGLVGIMMLAAVSLMGLGRAPNLTPRTLRTAGVAASFSSVVCAVGGPPLAVVYASVAGPRLRATLACHFFVGMVLALTARGLSGALPLPQVALGLALLPFAFVGYRLSSVVKEHVEGRQLRMGILVLVVVSAGSLLLRAVAGG